MRILAVTLLLLVPALSTSAKKETSQHIVLSADDLKKAPFVSSLEKHKHENDSVNIFWACFNNAETTMTVKCDERSADEFTGTNAILELRASAPNAIYDYGLRHAIEISDCRHMLRSIRRVQKKNLSYCILGYHSLELQEGAETREVNSTFYKLKSPLGYVIDMDY